MAWEERFNAYLDHLKLFCKQAYLKVGVPDDEAKPGRPSGKI
jgi:hypothetical protein